MKSKSRTAERYIFPGNRDDLTDRLVLLTGVTRSGIASLKRVEFEYDPWLFAQVPVLEKTGLMPSDTASDMLQSYVHELFTTYLMGRRVNFRDTDDSRILNYQSREELSLKWSTIANKSDAKRYAERHHKIFLAKMPNMQPFYPFLFRTFPKLKLIHIVRNGFDVALSIKKKRWLSDESLNHVETTSLKKDVVIDIAGQTRTVPWWLAQEHVVDFLNYSEFSRGLYCWNVLMEMNESVENQSIKKNSENYLEIRYEDLLNNPEDKLEQICLFLNTDQGALTRTFLSTIDRTKATRSQNYPFSEVDERELDRAASIMTNHGYELPVQARLGKGF